MGLIWIILKECIIFFPRYLVSLVVTLFQEASFSYYIGYVIGTAISIAVSQLNFDEEKPEENVKRIKEWTPKKILFVVMAVASVIAISVYFISREL